MDGFVEISKEDVPKNGFMKTIRVGDKTIALANIDGQYFAVDDRCSHEECSLGTDGALDGNTVVCGCHGAMFDVKTGAVKALPALTGIRSYKVVDDHGKIYVCIS